MSTTIRCGLPAETCLIRVSGADAEAFLQAQLTVNLASLAGNGLRLAPWLNAKGRVTGLFSLARLAADHWLLATHRSQVDWLVQRLRLFVLRAAVQIEPADDWGMLIIRGDNVSELASRFAVDADHDSWTESHGLLCRQTVPGTVEGWGPAGAVAGLQQQLPADPEAPVDWQRQWITAGLPRITRAHQERFSAHMLNLDLLGAVSFDKGCYPGQEVVARTQNLGRPKRRALAFHSVAALPEPGADLLDANGARQGEILNSAPGEPNLALAVVALAAAAEPLFLASARVPLVRTALPYTVPGL